MQPPAGSQVSRVPAQRPPSDQLAPPPSAPAPVPQRRRIRTIVTVAVAVLVALLLGGLAAGYVLYDRATAPDRSAPDVVVSGYLHAFLVDRNDARAAGFTCREGASLADLKALRGDLVSREERFATDISVSWGSLMVQREGDEAIVEVELIISAYVDGIAQTDRQPWRFTTRLTDDWRVCAGSRAG
ncbi:hypothetical protein [Micromonospora thermarum]|uniref:Nuclear transport factor 2 family protein n=1 Tax=Micromonospora thermarum TaxID=2720024 RepID=A0ABX0ZCR8_9ACTN|nr:hypothetical protein [Micromonospora thermarum]NJP34081.1 hypothetical protein [Micromonospora thermarum]